ncbi:MAG: hypothetical protein GX552_03720 [Chloroflexi bacterium]|jgi:alpha-galactosidase|nr:hypothetical protein [Chloroflexota bacterium]
MRQKKNEHAYPYDQQGPTVFCQQEGQVALTRLFGLACGLCEDGTGGLALLETMDGRYEAEQLLVTEATFAEHQVTLHWQVKDTPLRIVSRWEFSPDTGVWSRRDTLENQGDQPVILLRYLARFVFSPALYELYSQGSHWSGENQGNWQPLTHGSLVLRCEGGRTTQGGTPMLGLRPVEGRGGVAFHLLPHGNWTIRARARTANGDSLPFTVVELGLSDEDLRLPLPAHSAFELPEILFHNLPGGQIEAATERFHRYALSRYLAQAKEVIPLVYNTWFDVFEELDVPRLRQQLAAARDLGCEVFTIDAGWYGAGTGNWAAQTGDWREKRDAAFHGQMSAFADEVRAAGLGFGLWMEPERIGPEAPVLHEHPEWFRPATGGFFRPALETPQAYAYLLGEMARLVETYKLAWMKVDFNLDLGTDASGTEFSGYYTAWYRLLEELRASHPDTFFEGCASGGMRLDLHTLSHFDGHFLSDTVNPIHALRIFQGAALRLPPGRLGKWITLRPVGATIPEYGTPLADTPQRVVAPMGATWERSITTTVDFAARVCMPGTVAVSGDVAGLPPQARERLRAHLAFYKRWRTFIAGATAHLLTPPKPRDDERGWAAIQLQNPLADTSLLFVYRLDDACDRQRIYPRCLGDWEYMVQDVDQPDAPPVRYSGQDLTANGLEIHLPSRFSAALYRLTITEEEKGEII